MKERVTRAKIRDDIRLHKIYTVARDELLRYSYVEFKAMFKIAGVVHDTAGVDVALPLIRKMLSTELHCELLGASNLYFEDLKKATEHSIDGHGRKLDPAKYLALNSKAKGWISVGRDCDGDLVERYLQQCRAHEKGWHKRQTRIRQERRIALRNEIHPLIAVLVDDDAPGA